MPPYASPGTSRTVGGTSIMGLMALAAGPGTEIVLEAEGPEGPEAIEALVALVESGFGEEVDSGPRRA